MLSTLGGLMGMGLAVAGVHWFDGQTQNVGKPYWIEFTMNYCGLWVLCGAVHRERAVVWDRAGIALITGRT